MSLPITVGFKTNNEKMMSLPILEMTFEVKIPLKNEITRK
jgi:hypothetical protein